jgi:hypothetical protein
MDHTITTLYHRIEGTRREKVGLHQLEALTGTRQLHQKLRLLCANPRHPPKHWQKINNPQESHAMSKSKKNQNLLFLYKSYTLLQ